ncbi:penicillin-binding protein activator [Gallaecimonas sp. GXIMD4217]|uniref:penicillin-binding protein activator n=1 Tax=Gallaecimonas sp. GXIMD4217 TaxID=3131927 RepID=UPI00311AFA56
MARILARAALLLASAMLLSSCAGPGRQVDWSQRLAAPVVDRPASYLEKAKTAEGESQLLWQLQAGRAYAQAGDWDQAAHVARFLAGKLQSPAGRAALDLLSARLAIQDRDMGAALALLDRSMPRAFAEQRLRLLSRIAELEGDNAALLPQLKALAEQVRDPVEKARLVDRIWQGLGQVDVAELGPEWHDWQQLHELAQRLRGPALQEAIEAWQQQNPLALPARFLPKPLALLTQVQDYQPTSVAVLLPLTGSYAAQGQAIRDGLVSAYLDSGAPYQLRIYDSSQDVLAAWQQAQSEGAELLIGPLLRANVTRLQREGQVQVPWLALNRVFRPGQADSYFFALAPEDEAEQAAEKAVAMGAKAPLLLGLDSPVNQRQVQAFIQRWRSYGHQEPVEVVMLPNSDRLQDAIRQALHLPDSQARIRQMQSLLGRELEAEARSRRDLDFVYLVASGREVGLIKPFIDVSISPFAEPLPLFTSSRSQPVINDQAAMRDLRGLSYSELPLLSAEHGPALTLRQSLEREHPQWPKELERLFALGYDAARILPRLASLRLLGGTPIEGVSGRLHIDENGIVHRRLNWMRIGPSQIRLEEHVVPPQQDGQGPSL